MLSLWGVEGETYTLDGDLVVLDPRISYNGMNPEAPKKLNVDSTKAWIQKFITGQSDIETQWEDYKADLEGLGADRYVNQVNEIFQRNKSKLGY